MRLEIICTKLYLSTYRSRLICIFQLTELLLKLLNTTLQRSVNKKVFKLMTFNKYNKSLLSGCGLKYIKRKIKNMYLDDLIAKYCANHSF